MFQSLLFVTINSIMLVQQVLIVDSGLDDLLGKVISYHSPQLR